MNKPDVERVKQLIEEAPIGKYIGSNGARILAEHACCEQPLKNDEFLFHEGDSADSFYLVTDGRLAIVKERKKSKKPRILHVLEKGDLVGELSFIDDTPHTSSVMALGDASVLRFKADDIRPLITEEPQLIFDFMRAIIKRVHRTLANIGKQQLALSEYIASGGKGRF